MTTATAERMSGRDLAGHCRGQLEDLRQLSRELSETDWSTPSLCAGWTVKDVFAHLLGGRWISLAQMVFGIARYRSMDRWADAVSRRLAAETSTAELIEAFDRETRRWPEKGIAGLEAKSAKLADNLVHEFDIRRAVGKPRAVPAERMTAALDAATRTNMWGNKSRIKGLRLQATDLGWAHGDGPLVQGAAEELFLAINGRKAGLAGLGGDGLAAFVQRFGR